MDIDIDYYNPYMAFRPGQKEAICQMLEAYEAGHRIVELNAPTASGKCVSPDTPIIMFDGSVKFAKEIVIGDKLMGPDSAPRTVLSTTSGNGPMFKIVPTWGDAFVCNDKHILNLISSFEEHDREGNHYHSGMYKFGTTVNIPINEYISKSRNFKHHMKLWHSNLIEFSQKEVEWDPYVIGAWLGDGHKTEASITNEDEEVILAFKRFATEHGYSVRESSNGGAAKSYHMTYQQNQNAKTVCNTKGHFTTKSFRYYINKTCVVNDEKRIPKEYMINSRWVRLQLLAGLIDTDGSLANGTYFEISTKYPGLAKDICFLAGSLGFEARCRTSIKTIRSLGFSGTYYRISICGKVSEIPCKIERKKCTYMQHKRIPLVSAFRVESLGNGQYNGFTLDGDGLFLLGDFTVTHNSLDLYILGRILSEEYDLDKTIYSTPLVSLVDQLEYGGKFDKMPVLKGKRNYPCAMIPGNNADDCPFETFGHALNHCKRVLDNNKSEPCADCVYQRDRLRFNAAKFGATTFARYLVDPSCYGECRALLIDESAGLEKTLVDWSTLKLPDSIDRKNLRSSVVAYNQELSENIIRLITRIESERQSSKPDLKFISELTKALKKNERESYKCHKVINHIDKNHNYILDSEMRFRLLEGKSEFDDLVENLDFVVLASGTPTSDLYCDNFKKIDIQHPIAVDRRMVYFMPVGSMNYNDRKQTAPAMAAMIERLHSKYHKKTMVHCSAYNVANLIYSHLSRSGKKITILQDQKDREGSKNKFLSASEAIFLSVAFVEGLDLKGHDYPLNIIAKVPFENTSDEFIKARNNHDNRKRYNLFAAVEVMQAAGRCTRTPDDFSETYILDESWKRFYGRINKKFQPWFKAAIKNVNLD